MRLRSSTERAPHAGAPEPRGFAQCVGPSGQRRFVPRVIQKCSLNSIASRS